jgi:hypothetical protein
MGIDTQALEIQEAQVAALVDVRKKWHIPPAFRYVMQFCCFRGYVSLCM